MSSPRMGSPRAESSFRRSRHSPTVATWLPIRTRAIPTARKMRGSVSGFSTRTATAVETSMSTRPLREVSTCRRSPSWPAAISSSSGTTTGDQENASITALPNGGFVVTWQDGSGQGGDASGLSVKAQMYDAGGHKVGGEFLVNTVTTNDQSLSSVTALQGANSGGFLAVWEDDSRLNNDNSREGSIKAQMFDASGHRVGAEILVNAKDITYVNTAPSVIGLANGGFAITWQGQSDHPNLSTDTDDSNIQFQIFDASGHKVGTQLQVNTKGEEYQQAPKLTQLTNGFIVVTWEDVEDGDGDHGQIKARVIDANGNPVGDEFTVNSNADGDQHTPAIAARPDGSFIITWTDNNVATDDDDGIRGRIFSVSNGNAP